MNNNDEAANRSEFEPQELSLEYEERYLIDVLRAFLNEREPSRPSPKLNEKKLLVLAKRQRVAPIVADEMKKRPDFFSEELFKEFKKLRARAIVDDCAFQETLEKVNAEFEKERIRYLPLKGAIMKRLYPFSYQRDACDYDVLIEEPDLFRAKKILEVNLNYYEAALTEKHFCLANKDGLTTIELHRRLLGRGDESIVPEPWTRAIRDEENSEGSFGYRLTNEDFYLFMIAHLARHWLRGGVSIRFFVDVWIFNKLFGDKLRRDALDDALRKEGISEFARNVERAVDVWFGDEKDDDETTRFLARGIFKPIRTNPYDVAVDPDPLQKKRKRWAVFCSLFFCTTFFASRYEELKALPRGKRWMWIARQWARINLERARKRNVLKNFCRFWVAGRNRKKLRDTELKAGFRKVERDDGKGTKTNKKC